MSIDRVNIDEIIIMKNVNESFVSFVLRTFLTI